VRKVYSWKPGTRFDADAQIIGETIADLGSPTAEEIVSAAKPKSNPLHDLFEWDDAEAANEQRLETAQKIGRCLVVTVHMPEVSAEPIQVRAFESVRTGDADTRQYVPTMEALSNQDYREQIESRLLGELQSAQRQLDAYSYFGIHVVKASKHVRRAVAAMAAA
jgi:hypothetical protein